MRRVAVVLGASMLAASVAAPAIAQTQAKSPSTHAKRAAPHYSGEGQPAAQPRNGYQEQLADKMRFGSSAWWEQMRREGRLGGETP